MVDLYTKQESELGLSLKQRVAWRKKQKDADYWVFKGVVANNVGQIARAIDCYKEALKINQGHFPTMFNLATCFERQKKFTSALTWFKKFIKIKPELEQGYMGACLTAFKLGLYQEARDFVEIGIEIVKEQYENWWFGMSEEEQEKNEDNVDKRSKS